MINPIDGFLNLAKFLGREDARKMCALSKEWLISKKAWGYVLQELTRFYGKK